MAAFYPDAGTDLAPPVLFPEIKTWRYMDCQPRSHFLDDLNQTMTQCGFDLQKVEGDLRIYFSPSTEQTIYYETNTVFPDGWDSMRHKGDTLVLCGYDIDKEPMPPHFFSSYSHIITNDLISESIWEQHPHPISIIHYAKKWPHWRIEQKTTAHFHQYSSIERLYDCIIC
jgi:hypothetical protein